MKAAAAKGWQPSIFLKPGRRRWKMKAKRGSHLERMIPVLVAVYAVCYLVQAVE